MSYTIRRLLLAVPTALGTITLVFIAIHIIPGNPVQIMDAGHATSANIAQLTAQFGLNRPLWYQYLVFLGDLAHADLGRSLFSQTSVVSLIVDYFPYTLELTLISLLIATVVGIALGVAGALTRGSWLDMFITTLAVVGSSVPIFWLGLLLIVGLAIDVRLLPAGGATGALAWLLPSVTLAVGTIGGVTRMARSAMVEVLGDDFVRTARAKGSSEFRVVVGHALRNAMLPVVTVVGLNFGWLLGGAVVIEEVFSWPGMGRLLVTAIQDHDYPVIQGAVLVYTFTFIIVNILVDLSYAYIDPRVRYE